MRIDCHNDTQLFLREKPSLIRLPEAHLDYERMERYLDLAFFALWIEQKEFAPVLSETFRQSWDRLRADMAVNSNIRLLTHKEQLLDPNAPMALLCMEGAEPLGDTDASLDQLYAEGLRLIGMTWNYDTRYAGGAFETGGITEAGEKLIRRCNELGILLDGAHLNDGSFDRLVELSSQPVIDSHTVCRSLCSDYPRSISDAQLEELAEKGGVASICMVPDFLGGTKDLREFCRHVDYAVKLIGSEHVGIGADYDGTAMTEDMAGVEKLPEVYKALKKQGLTEEELANVAGDSVKRLLLQVLPERG